MEKESLNSDLVTLSKEIQEKQTHVIAGLDKFLKVWAKATDDEIAEENLNRMLVHKIIGQYDDDDNYYYYFWRGKTEIFKTTERFDKYENRLNTKTKEFELENLNKGIAINIARNIESSLKNYIAKLEKNKIEYDKLIEIFNKF